MRTAPSSYTKEGIKTKNSRRFSNYLDMPSINNSTFRVSLSFYLSTSEGVVNCIVTLIDLLNYLMRNERERERNQL